MKALLFLAVVMATTGILAQSPAPKVKVVATDDAPIARADDLESEEDVQIDFGGELRLRYEAYNHAPTATHSQADHIDYLRVRTRLWGKVTTGKLEGFLRLGNEFRYYRAQRKDKGNRRFPDVLYIDQLYVKYSDLWDLVDVKVGRQEFRFGSGRIFSDLTGGDGSRSNFADGVRLTFKFDKKRTLDAFAFYVNSDDWLPTAGHRHPARRSGKKSYDYDLTGYNHDELGAGLYYVDESVEQMPWEAYYVFKAELDGSSADNSSTVMPAGETSFVTHTAGFRLLPKFTQTLSGELEVAAQVGDDGLLAGMGYGALTYAPQVDFKPKFTLAVQYMSGDHRGGRGDHAWHPVFDRDTILGEVPDSMFAGYAHNNLLYPHLQIALEPVEHHTLTLQTGPFFAPVAERNPAGGEYGHFRGYYARLKYAIAAGNYFECPYAKELFITFIGEYMSKGDYFEQGERDSAYFARCELIYRF